MENPIKMGDLGGFPIIFGNTHIFWLQVIRLQVSSRRRRVGPLVGWKLVRRPCPRRGRADQRGLGLSLPPLGTREGEAGVGHASDDAATRGLQLWRGPAVCEAWAYDVLKSF